MESKSDNVKVICRVRPLLKEERDYPKDPGNSEVIQVIDNEKLLIKTDNRKQYEFTVPECFDLIHSQFAGQQEIFEVSIKPFIKESLREADSCAIFVYGQVNSGKRYTMNGTLKNPGILLRTCEYLLEEMAQDIKMSSFEIYEENVYDKFSMDIKPKPMIWNENFDQNVIEKPINSITDAKCAIKYAEGNVKISKFPEQISVISTIVYKIKADIKGTLKTIYLVKLQGSEKQIKIGFAGGVPKKEAIERGKSILMFKNIIMNLAKFDLKNEIPFRQTKLTIFLRKLLDSKTQLCFIITVCPISKYCQESLNSLKFGAIAKQIKYKDLYEISMKINEIKSIQKEKLSTLK